MKQHGLYGKSNKFAHKFHHDVEKAAPAQPVPEQKQLAVKGPLPSIKSDAEWVKKHENAS